MAGHKRRGDARDPAGYLETFFFQQRSEVGGGLGFFKTDLGKTLKRIDDLLGQHAAVIDLLDRGAFQTVEVGRGRSETGPDAAEGNGGDE